MSHLVSTFDDEALATIRLAFAMQMLAVAGVGNDPLLMEAFATVRREHYLGPAPWLFAQPSGYMPLPDADPVLAYQDVLFALSQERGVHNGSPSLHACWLHAARIKPGDTVVHLGAGTGYYSALIAHLVGASGRVTAVEYDGRLADLARDNLAHLVNVAVVEGDGASWPKGEVDCVYVNFSVERPAPAWIEYLGDDGRLIFPLGVPRPNGNPAKGRHPIYGAGFRFVRRGTNLFSADYLGPAFFVCAEGNESELVGSDAEREALKGAFERGGLESVRSLRWQQQTSSSRSWFTGSDWALCYDAAT